MPNDEWTNYKFRVRADAASRRDEAKRRAKHRAKKTGQWVFAPVKRKKKPYKQKPQERYINTWF